MAGLEARATRTAERTRATDLLGGLPGVDVDARAARVMARIGRTFDLAGRLLPAHARRDVRRLYLVLRTLDDLVDHADPAAAAVVAQVETWAAGGPAVGQLAGVLAELAASHPRLPRDAVTDFCAGMRADLRGPDHRTEADLARYCDQVAGTVGRLMAAVLGVAPGHEAEADAAARALGRAMQRTNILRDLVEDARAGRVYVPGSAFAAVGWSREEGARVVAGRGAAGSEVAREALMRGQISLADADFATGMAGTRHLRSGRRAVVAAALMYREILRRIERDGYGRGGRRAVVPRWRKAMLLVRAVALAR